jgi:3D (Asp-Asp-Asp) domain-containing protein
MVRLRANAAIVLVAAAGALAVGVTGAAGIGLAPGHGPQASSSRHPSMTHGPLHRAAWLDATSVTEYYPVPESWFVGRRVTVPGLAQAHRVDWLYSARGVSMEGDGIGLDGRPYHIQSLGHGGWIDRQGHGTSVGAGGSSAPYWRAGGYWLTHARTPTFPLEAGGWSAGTGVRYVALAGVRFAPGESTPLHYYRSVAVDPSLIPLGSRVYIPAYRTITRSHGWFVAADTGGAITGRHLDVFRPPPATAFGDARSLTGQRVYVIPPGGAPTPSTPPHPSRRPTRPPAAPGAVQAPSR